MNKKNNLDGDDLLVSFLEASAIFLVTFVIGGLLFTGIFLFIYNGGWIGGLFALIFIGLFIWLMVEIYLERQGGK